MCPLSCGQLHGTVAYSTRRLYGALWPPSAIRCFLHTHLAPATVGEVAKRPRLRGGLATGATADPVVGWRLRSMRRLKQPTHVALQVFIGDFVPKRHGGRHRGNEIVARVRAIEEELVLLGNDRQDTEGARLHTAPFVLRPCE